VGKGSCAIIDFPSGHLSLVDIDDSRAISEDEKTAMERLQKAKPNNPIDYIENNFSNDEIFRFILTHPDMDHMSGIKTLFKKRYVRNFWHVPENKPDPGNWENSPYEKEDWEFYQSLKNRKVSDVTVVGPLRNGAADCCWIQDGISILSPTKALMEKAEESGE